MISERNSKALTILLAEDDENDRIFITRAFKRVNDNIRLITVPNGEEAINYLLSTVVPSARRETAPLPDLIITDLKMPKLGGIDLLNWLNGETKYRLIPALVLTSSSDRADIDQVFEFGAKGYIIKPVSFDELQKHVKIVVDYWQVSRRPSVANLPPPWTAQCFGDA